MESLKKGTLRLEQSKGKEVGDEVREIRGAP
jgi:hypothetical protein